MKRSILALFFALVVASALDVTSAAQTVPEFKLGFRALADQIPNVVGKAVENEH